jgi:hypothetical protein
MRCGAVRIAIYMPTYTASWHTRRKFSWILCFVDRAALYNFVNRANLVHNFSYYVYFVSLHVPGNHVPIIRRNKLYLCDTWYMPLYIDDCLVCRTECFIPPSIADRHPYRVTNARCRIDTVYFSWWWAHGCPKHVENKEYTLRKNLHQVGSIHKTEILMNSTVRTPDLAVIVLLKNQQTMHCTQCH